MRPSNKSQENVCKTVSRTPTMALDDHELKLTQEVT